MCIIDRHRVPKRSLWWDRKSPEEVVDEAGQLRAPNRRRSATTTYPRSIPYMKLSTWLYIVLRLERESNEREMMMMMNGKAPASELRMISHSNRSPDEYRIDRHRWGNCLITTNCCCPFSPAIHSSFWAAIHNTVDPVIVLLTSMLTNSSPVH